ncbi:MAG: hypothetical protein PHH14_04585 [Candidatus Margulisbacteria bacterium]|nr:hypothetical protein [Candidatus Margulisiibacteriota bacterium]
MKSNNLKPHTKVWGIISHNLLWGLTITTILVSNAFAATYLDPNLKFKTIETPHFSIHYHDGEEGIAKRFAPKAEAIHERMTKILKHVPDMKTDVVLLDIYDYGNGITQVIPNPQITIYLTSWSTNLNPSKFDEWLSFVFLHEYAHLLHFDIAEGRAAFFRAISGRVIFPNAVQPAFMFEGLATYIESQYTQDGRGKDPRWEMMMRMDVLENDVKTLDQASIRTTRWPVGNLKYLYGVKFWDYVNKAYGEEKMITFQHVYGDYLISPLSIDGAFRFIYGKTLRDLWNEWLAYLRNDYKQQHQRLGRLTEPQRLTSDGYYNFKPKWGRDSRFLYYQQNNYDDYPQIRVIDTVSLSNKKLVETQVSGNNLDLTPDGGKVLFSRFDIKNNYYTYKDLCFYDLAQREIVTVTDGERADDASLSPDGNSIVYVKNSLGTNTLNLLNINNGEKKLIGTIEPNAEYFSPRWSPDGQRVAAAVWLPGGEQKIYLIDPVTGKRERITVEDNLTSEANPAFSPDGEYLYFDSDRTGIVNLYAYKLRTGALFQVTNVIGGAMMPDISPDGKKIAYTSYSSRGYDIAVMDVDRSSWSEVGGKGKGWEAGLVKSLMSEEDKRPATNNQTSISTPEPYYEIHDYQPLTQLAPKAWVPFYFTNENGYRVSALVWTSDIIKQHSYWINAGYDFSAQRPHYDIVYTMNQFTPEIKIELKDSAQQYSLDGGSPWMRERLSKVSMTFYDNRVMREWDKQQLEVGLEQTNITNISSIDSVSVKPNMGNVNDLYITWRYLNSRRYLRSISPENGFDLSLTTTFVTPMLGSDYSFTDYSGNLNFYLPSLFEHHVIVPRLFGFVSQGEQMAQGNFTWLYLPIRGYPATDAKGNKGLLLSNEYRFPIMYVERGFFYGGVFLNRIWGDFFFDIGGATFNNLSSIDFKRSVGYEFDFDTLLAGYLEVTFKYGLVKGLDQNGLSNFYFGFSFN